MCQDERRLSSFWDLFRASSPSYLRRTSVVLLVWSSSVFAYYAVALSSTSLSGDPLLNFCLSSLADVPSSLYVLASVDLVGRRAALALPLLLLSSCCLAMISASSWASSSSSSSGAVLALFLLGKFSSSAAVNVAWLYTGELYPTNLRAQAIACCSLVTDDNI